MNQTNKCGRALAGLKAERLTMSIFHIEGDDSIFTSIRHLSLGHRLSRYLHRQRTTTYDS